MHTQQTQQQSSKESIQNILDRVFPQKTYYILFANKGFSIECPEWEKKQISETDLIYSSQYKNCTLEIYSEKSASTHFSSYIRKISSSIRNQLNAKIISQNIRQNYASFAFELVRENTLWLYKVKILECNNRFYTVSFNATKFDFPKFNKIVMHVFSSIECYQPDNPKSKKFSSQALTNNATISNQSSQTKYSLIEIDSSASAIKKNKSDFQIIEITESASKYQPAKSIIEIDDKTNS